ncbi:MAG: SPASM domain-containing protein [Acidobacteria bacterium]|nr:SPASM domain-containing protein [Acidobacteriota bacterium]
MENSTTCEGQTFIESWAELKERRHPFAAIIKPIDDCNLACPYCYVNRKTGKLKMSNTVLETTIAKISELIQNRRCVHFIWHGGEPLLLNFNFYDKIIAFQAKYCSSMKIVNCIQTNGTLLTEEKIKFFAGNNFSISLSIDGPEAIHNINRKYANGQGTFAKIMEAVHLLREYKQVIGAVVVLTRAALANIKSIYLFMRESGIQFRINPIIKSGSNAGNYDLFSITPSEYGQAMIELFDLWFFDNKVIHIDPLNLIVGNMISNSIWGCDFHGGCLRDIICINPDGNLYPCGQLAGDEQFYLGNILKDSFEDIFKNPVFMEIRKRRPEVLAECSRCEFVKICNGGCMVSAWMSGKGIFSPDYFCAGRRLLFSHIRMRIKEETIRLKKLCNQR